MFRSNRRTVSHSQESIRNCHSNLHSFHVSVQTSINFIFRLILFKFHLSSAMSFADIVRQLIRKFYTVKSITHYRYTSKITQKSITDQQVCPSVMPFCKLICNL